MEFIEKVEIIKQYTYSVEKPFVDSEFNDSEITFILEKLAENGKYLIAENLSLGYVLTTNTELVLERNNQNDLVISTTSNLRLSKNILDKLDKELNDLIQKMFFHRNYEKFMKRNIVKR